MMADPPHRALGTAAVSETGDRPGDRLGAARTELVRHRLVHDGVLCVPAFDQLRLELVGEREGNEVRRREGVSASLERLQEPRPLGGPSTAQVPDVVVGVRGEALGADVLEGLVEHGARGHPTEQGILLWRAGLAGGGGAEAHVARGIAPCELRYVNWLAQVAVTFLVLAYSRRFALIPRPGAGVMA
jgi:hypothetical protein